MSSEAALQFTRGLSRNFTFNVTLLEDEIVEGPENFSVVLSVGDDKRNLVSFSRQSALVRIMDNDGKSNRCNNQTTSDQGERVKYVAALVLYYHMYIMFPTALS